MRNKYTDQILKAIDARGDQFETAVAEFAEAQKKRVLAAMSEEEASVRRKGLLDWFNLNRETKLLAEISLPFITDMVSQAATDALAIIEPDAVFSLTENIVRRIERRVQLLAESVNNTTLSGLEQTLAEGLANGEGIIELRDRVEAKYEDFPLYRNELIARTEATAATNSGHIEAYAQSETANAKEWIATRDSRTRPAHAALDGEIVALDANFSNGLQYPQEPNCRCVIAPAYVE